MSKRRKGHHGTSHYQVPSLKHLAAQAVRRNEGIHYKHNKKAWRGRASMDSTMSSDNTPSNKRAREGAEQVGQGLQVTVPRAIPHSYNNNFTVRLSYADAQNYQVSTGTGVARAFSMNSIWDPDVTGGGHQPMMRDLWASMYDYYAVLACRYKITVYNCYYDTITFTAAGTNQQRVGGVAVSILPTTNVADITSMASSVIFPAAEMKNSQTQLAFPEDYVVFQGTLTPGDFIVDAKDEDSDNTWTAVGSNPGVQRYLGISANSFNSGAFTGQNKAPIANVQYIIQLDYDVQFTQVNPSIREVPS